MMELGALFSKTGIFCLLKAFFCKRMCCSVYAQVCFTTSIVTVNATVWKQFQLLLICR